MTCERSLKTWSHFRMFDYKRCYKSHGLKIEKVLLYRNHALFLWLAKNVGKNLKQNISSCYCTISYCFQKGIPVKC